MIEAVRLGNRLTRTDSPSLTPPPTPTDPSTWSYDVANRLLIRPGVTYTYDNNGNTLTKSDATGTTTYGYDYENRLTSVSAPGGITASYAYDPFGRRISKTVNGVTTQYLYDGMDIVKEYDGTGTVLATYTQGPGIDEPIAMTRGGQTYDYHADGLGSVTGLTNSSQAVVQNYGYDGFGNLTQTPTVQNPYTYTGREWDAETGLYYYRARYYDAQAGRFISEDPIGLKRGINKYVYTDNNPVNRKDPSGLAWYGNWCGPGGSGIPIDCYDGACKNHDECYDKCGLDAKTRLNPKNLLSGCAGQCDKALVKDLEKCACSHGASGSW